MKIGILTFTNGTNIGQRLQNYALQETLRKYTDEVYTIKQKAPYSLYELLKIQAKDFFLDLKNPLNLFLRKKREKLFQDFNRRFIAFYDKELEFRGDNSWISDEFDAFVVGSDQIWNPRSPYVGDNFFLDFANPEKRFTYAPSFSIEKLPESEICSYKKRLMGFEEISVREDKGAEIIQSITGRKCTVVLDPTFLITRDCWDKIKEGYPRNNENGYALCMFLGNTDLKDVRKIFKNNVIVVSNMTPISPAQFLDIVERASIVFTDSYHVTLFSAIYHIPFVNFERKGTNINMGSRFETLYRELGIENRSWTYLKQHPKELYNMDFESIEKSLAEQRTKSFDFLDHTIGKRVEYLNPSKDGR